MKFTDKKKIEQDPIAEARKDKKFAQYLESSKLQVRLGVMVYKKRTELRITQEKLAEQIGTTQRIISNIENADINVGVELLYRLVQGLNFTSDDLAIVFDTNFLLTFNSDTLTTNSKAQGGNRIAQTTNCDVTINKQVW